MRAQRKSRHLLVILLVALISCGNSEKFIGPIGITTNTGGTAKPGVLLNVGFQFSADKGKNVHLEMARLIGVPAHLQVIGSLFAVRPSQTGGVGALWGDLRARWQPRGFIHPIDEVTLSPGPPADWVIVGTVKATTAGTFRTAGIQLTYVVDGKSYSQDFPFKIRLTADPNAPPV